MSAVQMSGLPPLPKCFRGILKLSATQWKELTTMHHMKTLIQQDKGVRNGVTDGDNASLDAPVSRLRREMVSLRQLDMSLLCQLWALNESLQEYKHILQSSYDRTETNSECSSYSLDTANDADVDQIPSIDEAEIEDDVIVSEDAEDDMESHIYENVTVVHPSASARRSTEAAESYVYTNTSFSPVNRYNSLPGHRHTWQDSANNKVTYF